MSNSMSPFVVFRVDFGHFYSRHFHHKKEVSRHFLALSALLTFPSLSIERCLEQQWLV